MSRKESIVYVSRPFRHRKHILTTQDSLDMYYRNNNCRNNSHYGSSSQEELTNKRKQLHDTSSDYGDTTECESNKIKNNISNNNSNNFNNSNNNSEHTSHVTTPSIVNVNRGMSTKPYVNKVIVTQRNHKHKDSLKDISKRNIKNLTVHQHHYQQQNQQNHRPCRLDDNNNNSSNHLIPCLEDQEKDGELIINASSTSTVGDIVRLGGGSENNSKKLSGTDSVVSAAVTDGVGYRGADSNVASTNVLGEINCSVNVQQGVGKYRKNFRLGSLKQMKKSRKRFTKSTRAVEEHTDDLNVMLFFLLCFLFGFWSCYYCINELVKNVERIH